jgi:hypothetical protein
MRPEQLESQVLRLVWRLFFATGLFVLLLTGITMSPWPGFLISLLFSLYGLLRASSPRQRWIGIGLSFAAGVPGLLSLLTKS